MTGAEIAGILNGKDIEDGDVLPTAIVLAATTGARRGELCALRWSDLNEQARGLRIASRPVQLGDATLYVLGCRRRAQEAAAAAAMVELVDDPFILSSAADGSLPCLPDRLTRGFRRLAMKQGLGLLCHFHDLRHYATMVAAASGASRRAVADRMGHSKTEPLRRGAVRAAPALTMLAHPDAETDRQLARAADASLPFLGLDLDA